MCKFTNAAFNFTNNHLTAEVLGRILNEKIFTCCSFSQDVVTYYFTFVFVLETFKNHIHINIYSTMFQFYFEQSVLKLDECCSCQRNFKRSEMLRLMFCMFFLKKIIYLHHAAIRNKFCKSPYMKYCISLLTELPSMFCLRITS